MCGYGMFLSLFAILSATGVKSMFQCDDYSTIVAHKTCDGTRDCPDGSDETSAVCGQKTCQNAFRCRYGACIKNTFVCDGMVNCADGSDEANCGKKSGSCESSEFRCQSGECIDFTSLCNGTVDCRDGSDETKQTCKFHLCPVQAFRCSYGACLSSRLVCDGIADCVDGSDELRSLCPKVNCRDPNNCKRIEECGAKQYKCKSGQCVALRSLCDGKKDCEDGSDETKESCYDQKCPSHSFRCSYGACVARALLCDEVSNCADGSDEDAKLCNKAAPAGSCRLPSKPPGGDYLVVGCEAEGSCQGAPHTLVDEFTSISYTCNPGYEMEGDASLYCLEGAWSPPEPTCLKTAGADATEVKEDSAGEGNFCPAMASTQRLIVSCVNPETKYPVPCTGAIPIGTVARFECPQYYHPTGTPEDRVSVCENNGHWSKKTASCEPVCGKVITEVAPLVVNGFGARYGEWPWQVGLYFKKNKEWIFWCGGSLVREDIVLTAAHCTWRVEEPNLRVAVGKYYKEFNKTQDLTQIKLVRKIIMHPTYQDLVGNYGSDIALLVLDSPVELSPVVQLVCLDWNQTLATAHITHGAIGVAAGWGVNENETYSDVLQMARLPVVPYRKCISEMPKDFAKFVAYTSFCAGYRNNTSVCNGDSGGGLVFREINDSSWTVQGVVSVSPRRHDAPFCDPSYYAVFTKVVLYVPWIKSMLELYPM